MSTQDEQRNDQNGHQEEENQNQDQPQETQQNGQQQPKQQQQNGDQPNGHNEENSQENGEHQDRDGDGDTSMHDSNDDSGNNEPQPQREQQEKPTPPNPPRHADSESTQEIPRTDPKPKRRRRNQQEKHSQKQQPSWLQDQSQSKQNEMVRAPRGHQQNGDQQPMQPQKWEGRTEQQAQNREEQNGSGKQPLRLRLDLNLDVELELKAQIHGDLTLALLMAVINSRFLVSRSILCKTGSSSPATAGGARFEYPLHMTSTPHTLVARKQTGAGPRRLSRPPVPPRASSVVPLHLKRPATSPSSPTTGVPSVIDQNNTQSSQLQNKSPPQQVINPPSPPPFTMQLRNQTRPSTRANARIDQPASPPRSKPNSPKPPVPPKKFKKPTSSNTPPAEPPRSDNKNNATSQPEINANEEQPHNDVHDVVSAKPDSNGNDESQSIFSGVISADGVKSPMSGATASNAADHVNSPAATKPTKVPPRRRRSMKLPQVNTNGNTPSANATTQPVNSKKRSAKAESPSAPSPKANRVDFPSRPSSKSGSPPSSDFSNGTPDDIDEKEDYEPASPSPIEEDEPMTPDPAESSLNVDELGNLLDDDGNIIGHKDAQAKSTFAPKPTAGEDEKRENAASGADGKPSDIFLDIKSTKDCIQIVMRIPTSGFGQG